MDAMTDPRAGLPSASSSERYAHCQGSFLAGRGMPETTNEDAESGTRIHDALADWFRGDIKTRDALGESDRETFDKCIQLHGRLISDLGPSETHKEALIEKRLWLEDEGIPKNLGSGQCDLVVMRDSLWLVIDWKTGRQQTTPAEANHQLRSLVGILRQTLGNDRNDIYAAIISPWQSSQTTVVKYDYQASLDALQATQTLFRSVLAGGARTPGDWCAFCPALGNCPEAQARAVIDVAGAVPMGVSPEQRMGVITGQNLADFLNCVPRMEDVIAAAKAEAKRRLDLDPESLPGYRLKPGAMQTTIRDLETVFSRFIALGGTQQQYLGALSAGKEKLSNALREATGLKGEALREKMEQLIAGCTEAKQKASSLERIDP